MNKAMERQTSKPAWQRSQHRLVPRLLVSAAGGWLLCSLPPLAYPTQTLAHETQISGSVGGTYHIEPNDTPRAGEPSLTWFALTQFGGVPIGLSDCDCELKVLEATRAETLPIARPSLKAIAVEGLDDVPASEVTFPTVGAYVLSLSGRPQGDADFTPFQLDFAVTVATAAPSPALATPLPAQSNRPGAEPSPEEQPSPAPSLEPQAIGKAVADAEQHHPGHRHWPLVLLGVILGGVAATTILLLAREPR